MNPIDHPILKHAPLPIGTLITIPKRSHLRRTQNPGPLRRGNPIISEWVEHEHGWPAETKFTITGVTVLHDTTTRIDECGEQKTRRTRQQIVYLARRTPTGREIHVHPHHAQTT